MGSVGSSSSSISSDTSTSSIEFEFPMPDKRSTLSVSSETLAPSQTSPSFSKNVHRDQPLLDKILQSARSTFVGASGTTANTTPTEQKVVGTTNLPKTSAISTDKTALPLKPQLTFSHDVPSKTTTKLAPAVPPKPKSPLNSLSRGDSASTAVHITNVSKIISELGQEPVKDISATKRKASPITVEGPSVQKLKEAFTPEARTNVARIISKLGQTPAKHVLASASKNAPTAFHARSDSKSIISSRSSSPTKFLSKTNDDVSKGNERKQSTSSSSFVDRISERKPSSLRKAGKVSALIEAYEGKSNPSQGQGHFSSKIGNESFALGSSNTAPKGRF